MESSKPDVPTESCLVGVDDFFEMGLFGELFSG